MGACETTPTTTRPGGHQQRPPHTRQPTGGCSSLPIIGRRLPASSSFVLAAPAGAALRALQLDPGPARRHKPAATRKATTTVPPQPRRPRPGHRVGPARPLDSWGPYGCGYAEPPIGIEPMTYALREARDLAAHALAAQTAPIIALMALT